MWFLSSFTYDVPNPYDIFSSVKHKVRYFEECLNCFFVYTMEVNEAQSNIDFQYMDKKKNLNVFLCSK